MQFLNGETAYGAFATRENTCVKKKGSGLSFYRKKPTSHNREKATCQLYFTDGTGKPVSNIAARIADKISDNGQERTFRCSFILNRMKFSSAGRCCLDIMDENGMVVIREEFRIAIAFAVDEFDFFRQEVPCG